MKLIKRALIAFALVRILDKVVFVIKANQLEKDLNDKEGHLNGTSKGVRLRDALRSYKWDVKEAQTQKAQVAVSAAELKKEMIENYV